MFRKTAHSTLIAVLTLIASLPATRRWQRPAPRDRGERISLLQEAVDAIKRERVRAELSAAGGNQTRAAALPGMQQAHLSRLRAEHELLQDDLN